MNRKLIVLILLSISISVFADSKRNQKSTKSTFAEIGLIQSGNLKLKNYAGEKIDLCISERIKKQDIEHLIEPFKTKTEIRFWQSEFWGKWMLSAVAAYKYTGDPELMKTMKNAVSGLLETQLENGYIGNYPPENQLTAWDIWGRKYSMLGLIRYYEISNDKLALQAAQKVADHLLSQTGPGKTNIVKTGNFRGMASSSVLEPIVYLYKHTNNNKYLEFANYIVEQWETEEGPQLISKAINGEPVSERFPAPENWWSWENGQKAYEMMSCYEGLLQLYLVNKNPNYLKAVENAVENIIDTEINLAGSGSAFECWYRGIENQTQATYHTMETCVTITWMKLCFNLLQVTGDSKYADQIELSFYNALLASMKYDAGEIAKYSPLEGRRQAGEEQCGMHINCCNANGPRGFTLIPAFAFMKTENTVFVNFYCESEATLDLNKNKIQLIQKTDYPLSDKIEIIVQSEKESEFEIALRIPKWSETTRVMINGEILENSIPGEYFYIKRNWKKSDKIELVLDLRGKLVRQNNFQAIKRGPIILSRDSRFSDGFVDETAVIQSKNGIVELIPVEKKAENIWMNFTAPLVLGTDLEGEMKIPRQINFCDFGSAGNTWDENSRYKVWIPQTLNVMNANYRGY